MTWLAGRLYDRGVLDSKAHSPPHTAKKAQLPVSSTLRYEIVLGSLVLYDAYLDQMTDSFGSAAVLLRALFDVRSRKAVANSSSHDVQPHMVIKEVA